jgi:hypothetical protein
MKRLLSSALFSVFSAMGCGGQQGGPATAAGTSPQGAPAASGAAPQASLSVISPRPVPQPPSASVPGGQIAAAACQNNAPFVTAVDVGQHTAQGYPIEIKGVSCASDGISVLVTPPLTSPSSIGDPGIPGGPGLRTFDMQFFYVGSCGTNLTFDVSTGGLVSPGHPRETDIDWARGISCLGVLP